MGGSSKSSSKSSNSTVQNDKRIAATDAASVYTVEGNNNMVTDFGLIEQSGEALIELIKGQNELASKSLQNANETGKNLDKVLQFASESQNSEETNSLNKMMPFLMAGVSVLALSGAIKIGK